MTATLNPSTFRAILIGDESLTIACGDMVLAGGHSIAAVVTRDDAVRSWALGQGLPVLAAPRDVLAADISADWLLSIANLRMIPPDVLVSAGKGAVNFHDGPLPRYAGLNTPAWAILNGETTHGISWHLIEGGVDEGDLLAQKLVDIDADETAFSLNSKCYAAGMESFATVLAQLEAGTPQRTPQDLSKRSYFARDQRPDGLGLLDFTQPAQSLSALVRGLDFGGYWNPLGVAKVSTLKGFLSVGELAIGEARDTPAGTVLGCDSDGVTVAAAGHAVVLKNLTDWTGTSVDPVEFFEFGAVLAHPTLPNFDVSDEPFWRACLVHDPVALPLATPAQGQMLHTRIALDLPKHITVIDAAHAVALSALKGAGMTDGILALKKDASHPLASQWLPLRVTASADMPVAQVAEDFGTGVARALESAGMLSDLALRDPGLSGQTPDIALSFENAVLTDAAATIVLGTEPALVYDANRLSAQAAALVKARLESACHLYETAQTCEQVWALPATEVALLQDQWNDTKRDYDPITIHAAFEAQVLRTPDAQALVFEAENLTFATLNRRANRLAHTLRDAGITPGTPVGLCTARGVDLLVGALGILKAGGAYVPLDPGYPADRIAHYISDSAALIIVTQSALQATLPDHTAEVLLIDADPRLSQAAEDNPPPTAGPDDLAYLIYTSGSTGTPKGVMVSHGNVANFFAGMDDRIEYGDGAVWLAVTSLSFDISVLELFWTLSRGLKLVLAGDESRTMVSNGPVARPAREIDFNLFYWGNDDGVGPKKYELLLEGAKFADAHGFNAIWTPERHFHAFGGPYPNPSVTGAAAAAVTQNIDIRAGSCVAPLHHPARIAEEWAVIDNLTNGRVGLAIASGWQPDDFVLRPENSPPDNKPAMYVAIDQLRKLWAGELVEFPKKDGTLHSVVTQPRPVSTVLPIWVTTAGNPQTWKEAGEIGANVLTHLLGQSVDEVAEKIKIYHAALRKAGHDPADFKVTVMLHTYMADTREAAEDVAREPMKDYLRSAAGLIKQYAWAFPAFKKPEGATNPFEIDLEGLSADEMDAILEFAFQRYFNDSGMFGTIEDGLARTKQLKRIGVDEVACLIDYGIDPAVVMAGLKPLAEVLRLSNEEVTLAEDDHSLAAQLVRHEVSHLQCTPSMAQMLVMNEEARAALSGVKHLMVGGEALPGSLVQALHRATDARLQNMYGPTETTIWSTTQMVTDGTAATTPIGTPIANTQLFMLDDKKAVQPIGVEGELWIGGDGVTQGYWQRETLSAERFIDNPFGGGKLYNTGDLAAWDAEGTVHFMGRADAQVKIRGHRIELGEIEARMAELPDVTQAVVVARDGPGGAQLVGYVTTTAPLDEAAAKRDLAETLPAIMVPAAIVVQDVMPLTPNKKIDRKALPAPRVKTRAVVREDAPVEANAMADQDSRTLATIAEIWAGLLGVSDIRGEDNFFDLGGHSLLAVQAHRDIKAALGSSKLSITDIFRFPTLGALAGHIDAANGPTRVTRRQATAVHPAQATAEPAAPILSPRAAELVEKRRAMRARRNATLH